MLARDILTIASDDRLIQILRWQLQDHEEGMSRMTVASTVDEACSLIRAIRPRLIVFHWGRRGLYEEVNRLLWTTTGLADAAPLLVIADWYRVEQATRLYRMGVTDYISRSHHEPSFGRVLDAYLRPGLRDRPAADVPAERRGHALESPTRSSRPLPARVG